MNGHMEFPDFNADALSNLTQKIQTNLQKPADRAVRLGSRAKSNGKPKVDSVEKLPAANGNTVFQVGKKRLRDGQVKIPASIDRDVGFEKKPKRQPNGSLQRQKGVTSKTTDISRGNINNRLVVGNGRQKAESTQAGHSSLSKPRWEESKAIHVNPPEAMKRTSSMQDEVLLLGGTQGDIDLIQNLGSDSEMEGPNTTMFDPKLLKDLRRFVKEAGAHTIGKSDSEVSSEDEDPVEAPKAQRIIATKSSASLVGNPIPTPKANGSRQFKLVFEARAEWHTADLPLIPVAAKSLISVTKETIDHVHNYARQLLHQDNDDYGVQNKSSSPAHQFYSTIMTAGTLSDKISALTLSVQESPVHNMKALDALISLARKRSRGQAVEVLGALKDLLGPGSLLPSDRKLKAFATQPGLLSAFGKSQKDWTSHDPLPAPLQEIHLVAWAYEDWLKTAYFEILKIIESWCNDEIVFARGKAVDYLYELLRDKPEQEANLLRLLVNKLGDSDNKISSKTSYNIIQLETSHPLMKSTIINSIESDLLFRPGQSMHAKYYAVITLNQTVLSAKEEDVAKKLLEIYFAQFLSLLAKPEPAKSAVPSANAIVLNKKGERQGGGGAPGKRAQQKLVSEAKNLTVDEEYREKMVSAVLTGVNRAMPYVKTDDESFDKHIDTLFRVTHSSNFNTSIQALMLIQQLCGSHQAASDRFYRTLYESLLDPRLLSSSKQAMYLNLLFKALRADLKVKRVEAFAKRLLQVVAMHQPPFACAVIYLLRELEAVFPNLQSFLDQAEEEDSEDEEDFRDVDELREADQPARALAIQMQKKQESKVYDGRKREPEYSNAEKSCLWEIVSSATPNVIKWIVIHLR